MSEWRVELEQEFIHYEAFYSNRPKRQQTEANRREWGGIPAYTLKSQDGPRRNAKRVSRNSTKYMLYLETDIMEHRVSLEPFRCKILAG